jgi:hypothetical protein
MPSLDEKPLTSSAPPPATSGGGCCEKLSRSHIPPCLKINTEKDPNITPAHHEFDPCANAKPCSPFYNHDSPRGSMDRSKTSLHVCVQDLEAQNGLTPLQTNEVRPSPADSGALRPWTTRTSMFSRTGKSPCLTKPKPRGCAWLSNMPRKQRLLVKLLIALVIVGAMVGIGVGVSLRVGGGVYKNQNSTSKIGSM